MPAQAKFQPIPADLNLNALVAETDNFDYVARISVQKFKELGFDYLEQVVLQHVIIGGKPLIIDGWQDDLPPWTFSPSWLIENVGTQVETVRDIGKATDIPMTIGHYMKNLPQLTKNITSRTNRSKRQRLYLKDINCPDPWYQKLEEIIPPQVFYCNENVGEKGGLGAVRERNSSGKLDMGPGIAPAGDLMSSLPPEMRAQNFMCYIGHEGTYTPAHREMCASLGQNIMVETSQNEDDEVPGSSIWFMTESKDREVVSEFFLSVLGHDIEVENHFAQIQAWQSAPFPVYIVEQKIGDLILIPPLAPHQVWNRGTRTMKAAWNRTTVDTLELAINEAIPRARLVCRDEQYKNKAIIYYTLMKYCGLFERLDTDSGGVSYEEYAQLGDSDTARVKQLQRDFLRLFDLFTTVLLTEMFDPVHPEKKVEYLEFDSNVTCSFCRCNIFNRFLTCKSCIMESDEGTMDETYDICMECYVMGRSCACISNLSWVEQWKWSELSFNHERWRARVVSILASEDFNGQINPDVTSQPLDTARQNLDKIPVAQICQQQLKLRPYRDPSTPHVPNPLPEMLDEDDSVNKKRSKRTLQLKKKTHQNCHICKKLEENWKLAVCCECSRAYCYGVLYRAFDLMPQHVLEQTDWKCPHCLKICSCGACRKDPTQQPYHPNVTLLGHDTSKVADIRSVESLVDFSQANLAWLKEDSAHNPEESRRMKNLVSKAIAQKALGDEMSNPIIVDDLKFTDAIGAPELTGTTGLDAPLHSNACQGFDSISDSQALAYDRHGIDEHPDYSFAGIDFDKLMQSEGSDIGESSYHQEPGSFFDNPNSSAPEYPALPTQESEIVDTNKGVKRKRPTDTLSCDLHATLEDAHSGHTQLPKKQKVTDAKADNGVSMTKEGDSTLSTLPNLLDNVRAGSDTDITESSTIGPSLLRRPNGEYDSLMSEDAQSDIRGTKRKAGSISQHSSVAQIAEFVASPDEVGVTNNFTSLNGHARCIARQSANTQTGVETEIEPETEGARESGVEHQPGPSAISKDAPVTSPFPVSALSESPLFPPSPRPFLSPGSASVSPTNVVPAEDFIIEENGHATPSMFSGLENDYSRSEHYAGDEPGEPQNPDLATQPVAAHEDAAVLRSPYFATASVSATKAGDHKTLSSSSVTPVNDLLHPDSGPLAAQPHVEEPTPTASSSFDTDSLWDHAVAVQSDDGDDVDDEEDIPAVKPNGLAGRGVHQGLPSSGQNGTGGNRGRGGIGKGPRGPRGTC